MTNQEKRNFNPTSYAQESMGGHTARYEPYESYSGYDPHEPYDPVGGHTKEEADAAYADLFRELHGDSDGETATKQKEDIWIMGPTDPDADSVCAAIAYANLKNEIDRSAHYTACSAGVVDAEALRILGLLDAGQPVHTDDVRNKKLILVNHNDPSQMPEGIKEASILEIIDRHRLGGPETKEPICVRCEPLGATSTIIYRIYKECGIIPDKMCAGLLCSGILSATRFFRTPETARADKLAAVELANTAGLDLEAHAEAILQTSRDENR
jgi:manganese-dependent inorganic pyrophosphatase